MTFNTSGLFLNYCPTGTTPCPSRGDELLSYLPPLRLSQVRGRELAVIGFPGRCEPSFTMGRGRAWLGILLLLLLCTCKIADPHPHPSAA